MISDRAGPVVRLRMAADAEREDVLAGLTPAARLALRNGQLAAVFGKLALEPSPDDNRRVLAVLALLRD